MQNVVQKIDGRRAKGDASRRLALARARDIALVDGLEGLTFGRVAKESGTAKSSLQILFGDRETLQLQTLLTSVDDFATAVGDAVRRSEGCESRPLKALAEAWFDIAGAADCGGCLLTSSVAEFSGRQGPISEAVKDAFSRWSLAIRDAATRAVASGEIAAGTDLDQLVFEILALQSAANSRIHVGTDSAVRRAARAMSKLLDEAKPT